MLLSLQNIAKFYGNRLIFKGISFTIAPASITLLAGANGAGKSTLLKIMAGLLRPDAGNIQTTIAPQDIGYLGHQTFLYPHLTARENLLFWSSLYSSAKKLTLRPSVDAALTQVGLQAFAGDRAGTFSRGMAQRLNLARVLMQQPKLLLLDEPTTGLDKKSKAVLDTELLAAARSGAGIVWISHSIEEDMGKADCLLLLQSGTLGYSGPAHAFTEPVVEVMC